MYFYPQILCNDNLVRVQYCQRLEPSTLEKAPDCVSLHWTWGPGGTWKTGFFFLLYRYIIYTSSSKSYSSYPIKIKSNKHVYSRLSLLSFDSLKSYSPPPTPFQSHLQVLSTNNQSSFIQRISMMKVFKREYSEVMELLLVGQWRW